MFARIDVANAPLRSKSGENVRARQPVYSVQRSKSAQPSPSPAAQFSWNFCDVAAYAANERDRPGSARVDGADAARPARSPPWPMLAKLAIGAVDDPLERDADQVAEKVMLMPDAPASVPAPERRRGNQKAGSKCGTNEPCADCQQKRSDNEPKRLQTKRVDGGDGMRARSPAPASVHAVLRSSGQPLDTATRNFMEPRFGQDLSRVRVHSDAAAQRSARDVNAHAYTVGRNIVFGAGRLAPGTQEGKRLIAHELAHVAQQEGAGAGEIGGAPTAARGEPALMRSVALDSTVKICRRVLESSKIKISQGGLRVALLLKPQDASVPDCGDHDFMVTLNRSNTFLDDELASCTSRTGGDRSFSFGNLSSGDYYLTISRTYDNPHCCLEGDILVFNEPITANSSGCVEHKALSALDIVHGALDIAGLIPVLGAIPDGINAGIYALDGDWANAGISVGAMIPFVGDGVLLGKIGAKTAVKFSEKAAVRLGEEGVAKALKVGREAAKAEKATVEVGKDVAKATEKAAVKDVATTGKEAEAAAKEAEKEAEAAAKKTAEETLKGRIKKCLEIYAAKEALGVCKGCKATDTKAERIAKFACLTAEVAAREKYLKEDCDDVLPGSIERVKKGQDPKKGHATQLAEKTAALANCAKLPTV
jgi:hypothetical protein